MGLCKCPRRKVTNLFCFEHRVNVCEHCLVANHDKCIVKSYLLWLQDSDYNPACRLCNHSLSEEECGECIRLTCYDVFHWRCLHHYCQQLPSTTAPAGYTCPSCGTCVFPPANLATPVAEAIRQLLQQVNWARAGLGLPLVNEDRFLPPPVPQLRSSTDAPVAGSITSPGVEPSHMLGAGDSFHNMLGIDDGIAAMQFTKPRKLFDSTKDDGLFTQCLDHDEDKYKRRPAFQWLAHWFRSTDGSRKRDRYSSRRQFFMVLIICIFAFVTLIFVFSELSKHASDDDPFLDPMNNPNIKVEQKLIQVN